MNENLEPRIEKLEAQASIRNLVARYCFTIDDHDLDAVARLFTEDAVVRSADGVMNATGVSAVIDQYRDRFKALGISNHITHQIEIELLSADQASGRVSSHAELWRNGKMMVAALQYHDHYRKTDDGWRFAERVISFLYYIPVEDYPSIFGCRDRNRAYAAPTEADYPEKVPTWTGG